MTQDLLKIREDYPFLSKDIPFDGSSYFYFNIINAPDFLKQRYGILKILKACRCSKRAIKHGDRNKYSRSGKINCFSFYFFFGFFLIWLVSLSQVLDQMDIIYEPTDLEEFLPIDNDTFLVKEYVKKMRKLEDFLGVEKKCDDQEEEETINKMVRRCKVNLL